MISSGNAASKRCTTDDILADRRMAPDELGEGGEEVTSPPIRADLVARVKRQIKLGMYEDDAKLDVVLDRLAAELLQPEEEQTEEAA